MVLVEVAVVLMVVVMMTIASSSLSPATSTTEGASAAYRGGPTRRKRRHAPSGPVENKTGGVPSDDRTGIGRGRAADDIGSRCDHYPGGGRCCRRHGPFTRRRWSQSRYRYYSSRCCRRCRCERCITTAPLTGRGRPGGRRLALAAAATAATTFPDSCELHAADTSSSSGSSSRSSSSVVQ